MAEMTLTISAVDKASAVVKGVEGAFDGFKGKIAGAFDSIKANFTSLHFAVTDAMQLIGKAFDSISRYAEYAEIKEQLNLMAGRFGVTGDSIVASLKKVTGGQLSLEQATKTAATALKNSLTPEQLIGLATAAATFADTAGVTVAQAFETLADAVQKGNVRAIASITGKDGLGDAMKVLESDATDVEKTMAAYNVIMQKTAEQSAITGAATFALADQLDTLKARIEDAKIKLGEQLTKAALYLTSVVLTLAAGLQNLAGIWYVLAEAEAKYLRLDSELAVKMGERADAMFRAAEENKKLSKTFVDAASVIGKADEVIINNTKALGAQTGALSNAATAATTVSAAFGQIKTAADSIPKDVQVKVTTTYVDVRTGAAPSGAENAVGGGPEGTSYGNWGGMFEGGVAR